MSKLRYMLEQLEYPTVLVVNRDGSENPFGGANQQATKASECLRVGASEATREALSSGKVMIWSALHSDMESQAEQEMTWPRVFRSGNNLDLRSRSVCNVPNSKYHSSNFDVVELDYRTHRTKLVNDFV